jgi:hypothetical protein
MSDKVTAKSLLVSGFCLLNYVSRKRIVALNNILGAHSSRHADIAFARISLYIGCVEYLSTATATIMAGPLSQLQINDD